MATQSKRKVKFLNLWQIRMPLTAWVSIMHRLSGLVLVCVLPWMMCGLSQSLRSEAGFLAAQRACDSLCVRGLLAWAGLAFGYHVLMGLRHLAMECHIGLTRTGARRTAWCVLGATGLWAVWLIGRLWC